MTQRRIVLVSGAPAAGQTSLAVPLARLLGLPFLAKDDLKEMPVDVLSDRDGDLGWSQQVGGAAMELLWKLAERAPPPSSKRTAARTAPSSARS